MPDEKELTVEEMKSLVSLATLLPALLDKISAINKDVAELKASFIDIKNRYNDNTKAVISYKESIDSLVKNLPDYESIEKELESIKQNLLTSQLGLSAGNVTTEAAKKVEAKKVEKPVKKDKAKEEKDEVMEIADRILADHRGRKTRMLTVIDVKKGFKVDDIMAVKVLKWLEDNKMYSSKSHMLTFPKR